MAYTRKLPGWQALVRLGRKALAVAAVAGAGTVSAASNGYVTFNEAAVDGIFAQSTFYSAALDRLLSIDIRFNPSLSIGSPSLVSIDSDSEFADNDLSTPSLNDLSRDLGVPNFTVAMFFVDNISFCGGPGSNIIGCGSQPGGLIALDSDAAAGNKGAALIAHELAHNLGLAHLSDSTNLMNPLLTGATALTATQIGSFVNLTTGASLSPIVRDDNGQLYISITPIAVLAAAPVPEPETWAMLSLGLLAVAGWSRRRQRPCVA